MTDTVSAEPTRPTIDAIVGKYVELRDKKAVLKKAYESDAEVLTAAMDKIETYLLGYANDLGVESFKTAHGTAYTQTRTSVRVADKDTFFNFVRDRSEWSLIEIRASKVAVEQFVASNEDVPAGLDITTERVLNVRRS